MPPFFQLGIAGATLPALSIKGEIGQQLGYMNAMGVGTVNFVVLVILGALPLAARAPRDGSSRSCPAAGSRSPPEDEYAA